VFAGKYRITGVIMASRNAYGEGFYDAQKPGSSRSAAVMVPEIVKLLEPQSVLDVGCGEGPWLAEFAKTGISECYGIDGPWVNPNRFSLGSSRLIQYDFASAARPFQAKLARDRFDLVITMEFLEHVRSEVAPALIEYLASLSDTIIMSAALPLQGGTDHVNEQWIDYWVDLFQPHGFEPFDFLRPLFWDDSRIEPWYRQNAIGFFRNSLPQKLVEASERAASARLRRPLRLVHPEIFELAHQRDMWKSSLEVAKRAAGPHVLRYAKAALSSVRTNRR
jgi:SAM-dependent methyltransferase